MWTSNSQNVTEVVGVVQREWRKGGKNRQGTGGEGIQICVYVCVGRSVRLTVLPVWWDFHRTGCRKPPMSTQTLQETGGEVVRVRRESRWTRTFR